jgi:hypothetical protein
MLDDLSNRPNLERAQAEVIVAKIVAVENATLGQRDELRQRLEARFGRLEPVVSQPSPQTVAHSPALAPTSIETQFRWIVLRLGLDAARAVIDDLSRLLTPL